MESFEENKVMEGSVRGEVGCEPRDWIQVEEEVAIRFKASDLLGAEAEFLLERKHLESIDDAHHPTFLAPRSKGPQSDRVPQSGIVLEGREKGINTYFFRYNATTTLNLLYQIDEIRFTLGANNEQIVHQLICNYFYFHLFYCII